MPSVKLNIDRAVPKRDQVEIWGQIVARFSELPHRLKDDIVMQECAGAQYRGLGVTSPHYVEVRVSMPDDEAELDQTIEDAILIANLLLEVTDVEVYHPATGRLKFRAKGQECFVTLWPEQNNAIKASSDRIKEAFGFYKIIVQPKWTAS